MPKQNNSNSYPLFWTKALLLHRAFCYLHILIDSLNFDWKLTKSSPYKTLDSPYLRLPNCNIILILITTQVWPITRLVTNLFACNLRKPRKFILIVIVVPVISMSKTWNSSPDMAMAWMPISTNIPVSFLYAKTGLLLASIQVWVGKYLITAKYLPWNSACAYIKKRTNAYGNHRVRTRIRKIR